MRRYLNLQLSQLRLHTIFYLYLYEWNKSHCTAVSKGASAPAPEYAALVELRVAARSHGPKPANCPRARFLYNKSHKAHPETKPTIPL